MFRWTQEGLNRRTLQSGLTLPEYPLPKELVAVLDIEDESPLSRLSQMYSNILEKLDPVKYVDLSEEHYVQLLKFALYLEEYQSNEEMKKRKMTNQTVKKLPVKNPYEIHFSIHVKQLDEERAWIREGDLVDLTDPRTTQTYTLKVVRVEQSDIVASDEGTKFRKVFGPRKLYNISFRFQNYPLKCAHYALWLAYKENAITYIFPRKAKEFIDMESASYEALTIFNANIETNHEQKQAVQNILNKSSFPAPYILYGPPGTGKTATLIETICQIKKASSRNRILVCTPSNTAADEVAKRLLKFLDAKDIFRIYSQSKDRSSVDKELKNCCFCGGGLKNNFPLRREDIAGKAVLISTLCTAIRFVLMKANGTLSATYFSHIIIDEAGQGTEPDILIPISIASSHGKLYSQIVLAGDPQQLGPTVISKLADKILGRSILERMMSYDIYSKDAYNNYNSKYITKLLQNYRSHPSIIHISNKLFYDNELVAKFTSDDQNVEFPVIFHGVEGTEEKFSYSPSTYNNEEINMVMKYVYDLIDDKTEFGKVSSEDIGIVTPFKLQSKQIRKKLQKMDWQEQKNLKDQKKKKLELLKKDEQLKSEDAAKDNEVKVDKSDGVAEDPEVTDDDNESKIVNLDSDDEKNVLEKENEKEDDKMELQIRKKLQKMDWQEQKNLKDQEKKKLELLKKDEQLKSEDAAKDNEVKVDKADGVAEDTEVTDDDNESKIVNLDSDDEKNVLEKENEKEDDKMELQNEKEEDIKLRRFKDINVGTVELFQGQERKIMIMTAVRSKTFLNDGKEHIGFLSNPKRFNVAMTRAQNALIVIGNPEILQKDGMWQYLLEYCIENGSYRGLDFALGASSDGTASRLEKVVSTASLFRENPFKLFRLSSLDWTMGISRTVDLFVEPDKKEVEERRVTESLSDLILDGCDFA